MTKEEKYLVFTELCIRLPFGIKFKVFDNNNGTKTDTVLTLTKIDLNSGDINSAILCFKESSAMYKIDSCKPYLRPLSSMTDNECFKLERILSIEHKNYLLSEDVTCLMDFYNQNHFDYNYRIEQGLALEAPEDMYK